MRTIVYVLVFVVPMLSALADALQGGLTAVECVGLVVLAFILVNVAHVGAAIADSGPDG
mgnify:CR=1 FL=1